MADPPTARARMTCLAHCASRRPRTCPWHHQGLRPASLRLLGQARPRAHGADGSAILRCGRCGSPGCLSSRCHRDASSSCRSARKGSEGLVFWARKMRDERDCGFLHVDPLRSRGRLTLALTRARKRGSPDRGCGRPIYLSTPEVRARLPSTLTSGARRMRTDADQNVKKLRLEGLGRSGHQPGNLLYKAERWQPEFAVENPSGSRHRTA
jgi:hypothetical protein